MAEINVTDGVGTAYTYDDFGNLIGVKPATYVSTTAYATVNDAESVDYTYNSKLQLDKINTDSTEYSFTYDAFGNTTSIKAGTNTLASYTYNSNNGKLSTLTYGNGLSVSYVYDALENISEVWYNIHTGSLLLGANEQEIILTKNKVFSVWILPKSRLCCGTDWR